MIYRIFGVLVLLAVVAGSVLFSGQQRENAAPATIEEPLQNPGYAAHNARMVQTGADGRPLYVLDADTIRQQPDQNTVQLEQVKLSFHDTPDHEWTARAKQGEIGQDTGKIGLSGDVHVSGLLPGTQDPTAVSTQRLSYDTTSQILSTQEPVTLDWSGHQLHAVGLEVNLKGNHVQLKSQVHGTFTQ